MSLMDNLHIVQCTLRCPKTRRNNFGNYNYRNAEDILDGLKQVMPKGCAVTCSDEIVSIGDSIYVKATATFWCGSEKMDVTAYAREPHEKKGMDVSQITGSASTYARKYALNGLFAIDDSIDADSDSHEGGAPPKAKAQAKQEPKADSRAATLDRLANSGDCEALMKIWEPLSMHDKETIFKQLQEHTKQLLKDLKKNALERKPITPPI